MREYHIFRFIFEKPYVEIKWLYIKYIRASGFNNITEFYLIFRFIWQCALFMSVILPFWAGFGEANITDPNCTEFFDFTEKRAKEKGEKLEPEYIAYLLKYFLGLFDLCPFWWFCIFWVFYIAYLIDLRIRNTPNQLTSYSTKRSMKTWIRSKV